MDAGSGEWNAVLERQFAHRSVRRFLEREVGDPELLTIVAAAQSAATSSNLQSWSVVSVRDRARLTRLAAAARQPFISAAPLLLVWVADYHRAGVVATDQGGDISTVSYLEQTLTGFVDAAIAAQNAVLAAESLGLGTVIIGSIRNDPETVQAELGLPRHTFPVIAVALGYPDPEDTAGIKPRLAPTAVHHAERYRDADTLEEVRRYQEVIADYYRTQGSEYDWPAQVAARVGDIAALSGREGIRGWLTDQGFDSH
ncbi:NADPH-dependent oxidoreductase [Mycetocola tolaasinivorans]|uniref:NADPH-dependent oxidoreductase n=1 Tax=Mycetocola tolaasinivorans TaxID=76635 RepID=A0A3L7A5J4_9MICO|nr:NADPH-dependent oxidoreductase [Mycetocola tolaasinivorans]